jgi:deoxyribodipyrimidine photo-lyase
MQSWTTGINTVRIYSPAKQAIDQDPDGVFIRRWVPELARVPVAYLARPETMPAAVQDLSGCRLGNDYPRPIVDHAVAYRQARERLQSIRSLPTTRSEARRVLVRHGSRKGAGFRFLRAELESRGLAARDRIDLAPTMGHQLEMPM